MAIPVPVTRTKVATVPWGIPITNEVNRLTAAGARAGASRSTCQSSFPTNAYTGVVWSVTDADTGGFISNTQNIVIPTGMDGIYSITYSLACSQQNLSSYMSVYATYRYDFNGTGNGYFTGSITVPLAAGVAVYLQMWNGSGGSLTPTSSKLYVYRLSS